MHIIVSWHSSRAPLCDSLSINSLQTDMHNVACSGSFDHGTSPHPTNPARTNASKRTRHLPALKREEAHPECNQTALHTRPHDCTRMIASQIVIQIEHTAPHACQDAALHTQDRTTARA
jgi:hypothetical protein